MIGTGAVLDVDIEPADQGVHDFVKAWTKVMELDRFDLVKKAAKPTRSERNRGAQNFRSAPVSSSRNSLRNDDLLWH